MSPFIDPPPPQIPLTAIPGPNPSGVEWQNYYCAVGISTGGIIHYAPPSDPYQTALTQAAQFAFVQFHGPRNCCKHLMEASSVRLRTALTVQVL